MKRSILLLTTLFTISLSSQENKKKKNSLDSIQKLDEIIISTNKILGNKYVAKNRTGSAFYLSTKELQKFNFTDVNRVAMVVNYLSSDKTIQFK